MNKKYPTPIRLTRSAYVSNEALTVGKPIAQAVIRRLEAHANYIEGAEGLDYLPGFTQFHKALHESIVEGTEFAKDGIIESKFAEIAVRVTRNRITKLEYELKMLRETEKTLSVHEKGNEVAFADRIAD